MLQGHPSAGPQGAQVLGDTGTATPPSWAWGTATPPSWPCWLSLTAATPPRALLNWRTKLRRFLAKKLKEQAKELDIK